MNCPRCTMLLGLLAAALLSNQSESTNSTTFTSGMRSVCVQGLQLHYTRNVSEAEAERVAIGLVREGIPAQFRGPMRFDHTEASARLDVTATEAALQDSASVRRAWLFAARLSDAVLKGAPVRVCMRDAAGKAILDIAPADESPFFYN